MDHATLLTIAVEPRTDADRDKLREALAALIAQDPTVRFTPDAETHRVIIGASSEARVQTILDRLRREFSVDADVGCPQVAYKETLTRPADGEMKYAKQNAERGEYGHVKIRLRPGEPGSGVVLENEIVGGAIPAAFIAAVNEGIRDAMTAGVLRGHPVDDVRIELYDGSYHDTDSSDAAFRTAGARAFQDAAKKAHPVLLEPVMRVQLVVLEEHVADVKGNLLARRGELLTQESRGQMHVVTALVPLAQMFGYEIDLRERTRGQATVTMQFERYQPAPIGDDDGEGESFVGAPRKRPPTARDARIALPEPD